MNASDEAARGLARSPVEFTYFFAISSGREEKKMAASLPNIARSQISPATQAREKRDKSSFFSHRLRLTPCFKEVTSN